MTITSIFHWQKEIGLIIDSLSFQRCRLCQSPWAKLWVCVAAAGGALGALRSSSTCPARLTPWLVSCRECSQALEHSWRTWRTCCGSAGCTGNVVCSETLQESSPKVQSPWSTWLSALGHVCGFRWGGWELPTIQTVLWSHGLESFFLSQCSSPQLMDSASQQV